MSEFKLPISCEQFEARVSDYIDGTLPLSERAVMDAHGKECASCSALLSDVRQIVGNAATLPQLTPSRDLWAGIAERLDTPVVPIGVAAAGPVKRMISFRTFAAAAALLISVSSGITYVVMRGQSVGVAAPAVAVTSTPANGEAANVAQPNKTAAATNVPTVASTEQPEAARVAAPEAAITIPEGASSRARNVSRLESQTEFVYEREISAMRRIVDERLGDLDSVTVVEIERNLRIIDQAIVDSRRALQNDPRSRFLSKQLDRALETKLDIMRRIAQL